jgi:putative lipoprotein
MLKLAGGWRMFALWLVGMLGWAGQTSGQVRGTVTYRERLALPPDAVFEATLEDVSRAYVPAEVLGRARYRMLL